MRHAWIFDGASPSNISDGNYFPVMLVPIPWALIRSSALELSSRSSALDLWPGTFIHIVGPYSGVKRCLRDSWPIPQAAAGSIHGIGFRPSADTPLHFFAIRIRAVNYSMGVARRARLCSSCIFIHALSYSCCIVRMPGHEPPQQGGRCWRY